MSPSAPDEPAGRCLVLGYDGSDGARRAAAWAVSDLPPDGRLVLVRAGRPLHLPPSPLSSAEERAQVGHALFDELLLDGEESLLDVQLTTEVSDEDPVTALLDAAQRHHAHAIVLGCEQHSRLRRVIGVVTSELLARSPVPVISVPAASGS
jgi:nucleotide-binding universal stress UspA family protein